MIFMVFLGGLAYGCAIGYAPGFIWGATEYSKK